MKTLTAGLLMLMVSSCGILNHPQPSAVHDFGYPDANAPSAITTLTQQSQITVESPKWLSDNRLRYRLLYATPSQVRFYSLDRWIASPPELFEQLLNSSGKHWHKPVTIRLQVFEQQFDGPNRAKAVMDFTAALSAGNNQNANKRDFHLQQPCPTPDAKGAVIGFNLLTRQAVDKVQAWLMETQ